MAGDVHVHEATYISDHNYVELTRRRYFLETCSGSAHSPVLANNRANAGGAVV